LAKIQPSGPCEKCGTNKTYVRSTGTEEWKKTETGYLCKKCFMKNYNRSTYVSNPREIPHGPCVECNSETTYVRPNGREDWKKSETGSGYLCKLCAGRDLNSKKWVPKGRTPHTGPCVECNSETTYVEKSGYVKWYAGSNGTICKKCFNRKNDRVLKSGQCVKCGIGYTRHGWTMTEKGTICQTCYRSDYSKIKRKGNCRICNITEHAKWSLDKEHGRICGTCYHAIVVKKLKKETFSHYSNGKIKCVTCGYNKNINALELDHIDGKGNDSRKKFGSMGGWAYYKKLKTLDYPEGYQVLCSNCNKIKQIEVDPK
jgi:hypothetical protein